jgi:thymidylate synthase
MKEIVYLLNRKPHTKRAVMVLFDPSSDYTESKDVPCNNWIHFMIRDKKLHMHITARANDIMWGFSGINTFEWSVLHEMMAVWTNTDMGESTYFTPSLHLYKHHYKRAKKIIDSFKGKSLYDFGFKNIPFNTPLDSFDAALSHWFEIEAEMRMGEKDLLQETNSVKDDFLRICLQMIYVYNKYINGGEKRVIADILNKLPVSDFKIAAIEYFTRIMKHKDLAVLNQDEHDYFEYYWSG